MMLTIFSWAYWSDHEDLKVKFCRVESRHRWWIDTQSLELPLPKTRLTEAMLEMDPPVLVVLVYPR